MEDKCVDPPSPFGTSAYGTPADMLRVEPLILLIGIAGGLWGGDLVDRLIRRLIEGTWDVLDLRDIM